MVKRTVHANGLLRSTSVQYDLRDPEELRASLIDLKRISIRQDLGETLESKLREDLRNMRAAAVEVIGRHGYPTEDGVYLKTSYDGYRKLSQHEVVHFINTVLQPGETRSFVRFPFFNYKKLSQPDLAAQLIFEIDLLVSEATAGESLWPMVLRAIRFATAYHYFAFDASGANRLASIEHRRSINQRSSVKKLTQRRRVEALALRDRVQKKAKVVWSKNPTLTRSAMADRIAGEVGCSSGHVRRILRSTESPAEHRD